MDEAKSPESFAAGAAAKRDKSMLLQREYRRRYEAAGADLAIARWRLQEAAVLLLENETAFAGDSETPEEMFAPLREKYHAFLAPLLPDAASSVASPAASPAALPAALPLDSFLLRAGLCDALADTLFSRGLFGAKSFAQSKKTMADEDSAAFPGERAGFPLFSDERTFLTGEKAGFRAVSPEEGEKIVYVRNHFADMAYDHFFPYLDAPKAVYADSFSSAAELFADGGATGILLPYETEDGRLLRSVEQLLDGYDFKKELISPLSKELGNASYALLRRGLRVSAGVDHGEFRLPKSESEKTSRALFELPLYAAQLGAVTERTETVLRERGSYLRFLFCGEEKMLLRLFFFLSMEYPDFTAGGFYKILPGSPAKET